jgi:hypothetical protein
MECEAALKVRPKHEAKLNLIRKYLLKKIDLSTLVEKEHKILEESEKIENIAKTMECQRKIIIPFFENKFKELFTKIVRNPEEAKIDKVSQEIETGLKSLIPRLEFTAYSEETNKNIRIPLTKIFDMLFKTLNGNMQYASNSIERSVLSEATAQLSSVIVSDCNTFIQCHPYLRLLAKCHVTKGIFSAVELAFKEAEKEKQIIERQKKRNREEKESKSQSQSENDSSTRRSSPKTRKTNKKRKTKKATGNSKSSPTDTYDNI